MELKSGEFKDGLNLMEVLNQMLDIIWLEL